MDWILLNLDEPFLFRIDYKFRMLSGIFGLTYWMAFYVGILIDPMKWQWYVVGYIYIHISGVLRFWDVGWEFKIISKEKNKPLDPSILYFCDSIFFEWKCLDYIVTCLLLLFSNTCGYIWDLWFLDVYFKSFPKLKIYQDRSVPIQNFL